MSERQPVQHERIKKLGRLGTLAAAAGLAVGASSVPVDVKISIEPRTAEATTCTPYTIKHLDKRSTPYSIRGKRFVVVGDISVNNKGLHPDKDTLSRQISLWNLPATATQSGILSDKGDSHVEIFNSCATTSQVRAEVLRLEQINVPDGNAEASIDFHEITTTAAEPHTDPAPTCSQKVIEKPLPATSETGTETISNIKRAIITGDIKVQNAVRDNNGDTGMTTIVNLPSEGNLDGINAPYGGWIKFMSDCASTNDFDITIGSTQRTQTDLYPAGQQTFIIKNP